MRRKTDGLLPKYYVHVIAHVFQAPRSACYMLTTLDYTSILHRFASICKIYPCGFKVLYKERTKQYYKLLQHCSTSIPEAKKPVTRPRKEPVHSFKIRVMCYVNRLFTINQNVNNKSALAQDVCMFPSF